MRDPCSTPSNPAVFARGELVDNFQVLRLLGRGGMGEVYLALDTKLGRKVALKAIHPRYLGADGHGQATDRFLFEAKATARFNHPHIVTVYAVGEHRGMPYVALEYLPGRTLREQIDERTPALREVLRIGHAIAEALQEAHTNKILHRDLKPENILIPKDGRLRVVDFGLAKKLSAAPADRPSPEASPADDEEPPARTPTERGPGPAAARAPNLDLTVPQPRPGRVKTDGAADTEVSSGGDTVSADTQVAHQTLPMPLALPEGDATLTQGYTSAQEGTIRGTPYYMAPEQWRGEATSEATDLWALGVILHELLCGRHPYPLQSRPALQTFVCGAQPMPALQEGVPEPLAALVSRCLERDPARRPTSADVIEQLDERLQARRFAGGGERGPFRGLLPFSEEHADVYFGRMAEVDAFVEKLRLESTVAVVGPSGAGKTSFVRAGVIPRLREQGTWIVLVLRPGHDPFRALAARLQGGDSIMRQTGRGLGADGVDDERRLAEELQASPGRLALHLRQMADEHGANVLLAVDQLEELYTHVEHAEVRRAFMRALCTAADDHQDPLRVVFTLRDDFLGRVAEGSAAREALSRVTVLRAPGRTALREILTRPLQVAGYRYDDETLVETMIDSVAAEPACLPLIQFAARALWERRDPGKKLLLRAAHDEVGGVVGALAAHADSVLDGLSAPQRRAARQLLLRLVTAEGTRHVVPRHALLDGLGDEARHVLERLTQARLVSVQRARGEEGDEALHELAHESLIQRWARLAQWLEVSQEERAFLAEVGQAAELWRRRGRREQEVWQGAALADAMHALRRCSSPVPQQVRTFLEAGERRRTRGRRLGGAALVAVGLVLITAVTVWVRTLTEERREAQTQRARAERMSNDALRSSARLQLVSGQHPGARASLRGALEIGDSREARRLWMQLQGKPLLWELSLHNPVNHIAVSPDGKLAAIAVSRSPLRLLDLRSWRLRELGRADEAIMQVAFGPQSRTLISCSNKHVLKRWDLASGADRLIGTQQGQSMRVLTVAPGGRWLYSSSDKQITRWDLKGSEPPRRLAAQEELWALSFVGPRRRPRLIKGWRMLEVGDGFEAPTWRSVGIGPRPLFFPAILSHDGRLVAACDMRDRSVLLVDLERAAAFQLGPVAPLPGPVVQRQPGVRRLPHPPDKVNMMRFSRDGRRMLVASNTGQIDLWDTTTGARRQSIITSSPRSWFTAAALTPDGRRMLAGDRRGMVRIWRVGPEVEEQASGHTSAVVAMGFRPSDGAIISAGLDGLVIAWDRRGHRLHAKDLGTPQWDLAFGPNGRRMVTAGDDAIVRFLDANTGRVIHELRGHRGAVKSVDVSPDGRLVASGGVDGTARLWRVKNPELLRTIKFGSQVANVCFHPSGELLAVAGVPDVKIFDVSTGALQRRIEVTPTVKATYTPQGQLVYKGADSLIRFFPHRPGTRPFVAGFTPLAPTVDAEGARLLTQRQDSRCIGCVVQVGDLNGRPRISLLGHHATVNSAAFSADGSLLATGDRWGVMRLWSLPTGRPVIHAPLLLTSPPRLITSAGPMSPAGTSVPGPAPAAARWLTAVQTRASQADLEPGGTLCVLTHGDRLERWSTSTDRLEGHGTVKLPKQVVALRESCTVRLTDGRLLLQRGTAEPRELVAKGVHEVGQQGGRLLVTTTGLLTTYDARGTALRERRLPERARIARDVGSHLMVGLRNNLLVRCPPEGAKRCRPLAEANNAQLTTIIAGPAQTVIAGDVLGIVTIWDLITRKLVRSLRLNGRVTHLHLAGDQLHAATDVGDYRVLDLSAYEQTHCALLRRVWREVPVVWQDGELVPRAPDRGHQCAVKTLSR